MSDVVLNSSDLPLGTIFPEVPYIIELARAIEADKAGDTIMQTHMRELEKMHRVLWSEAEAKKAASMKGYAFSSSAKWIRHRLGQSNDLQVDGFRVSAGWIPE